MMPSGKNSTAARLKASDGDQLRRATKLLFSSERLLASLPILSIDRTVAAQFDALRQSRKTKSMGRADLLIASIALAHQATVVTRNLRHFRQVPGLRLENWVDD